MTVSSGISSATLNWTGAETSWNPGFQAEAVTDVSAVFTEPSGPSTTLNLGVQFAASLDAYGDYSATPLAMPAPPGTVTFTRNSSFLQAVIFQDGVPTPASSHQFVADSAVLRDQEIVRRQSADEALIATLQSQIVSLQTALALASAAAATENASLQSQITNLQAALGGLLTYAGGSGGSFSTALLAMFASLPTSLPASSGTLWNDGGLLAIS